MIVHCSETGSVPLENPTQYFRVDDSQTTYMAIFRTSQLNKTMVASREPDLSNRKKKICLGGDSILRQAMVSLPGTNHLCKFLNIALN